MNWSTPMHVSCASSYNDHLPGFSLMIPTMAYYNRSNSFHYYEMKFLVVTTTYRSPIPTFSVQYMYLTAMQLSSSAGGPIQSHRRVPGHSRWPVPAQPLASGHVETPAKGRGPPPIQLLRALQHHQEEIQHGHRREAPPQLHHSEAHG